MKKKFLVCLALLALLGLIARLTLYFVCPPNHLEIQIHETRKSPDEKWTAVVQMEVNNVAWVVNDVVYAVRLKAVNQKDREEDLVMNVPVNYPDPAPSINWSDGKLVVTLSVQQKYQYYRNTIQGIAIVVQQK
jgi:hypothetical protein